MRRPKGIKTKKSVAKRFKITASGRVSDQAEPSLQPLTLERFTTYASYKRPRFPQAPHKNDPGRQRLPDAPLKTLSLRIRCRRSRPSIRLPRSPSEKTHIP